MTPGGWKLESEAPMSNDEWHLVSQTPMATVPQQARKPGDTTGSWYNDALVGVGSGAIGTGVGLYDLTRMIPGMSKVLPAPTKYIRDLTVAPNTLSGGAGKFFEQAVESFLPAAKLSKFQNARKLVQGGRTATGLATVPAKLVARNAVEQGLLGAATSAAQTGQADLPTLGVGFAGGAGGDVLGAAGRLFRRGAAKTAQSAIGTLAEDLQHSRTPGLALLDDTKGLTPQSVAESARGSIDALDIGLDNVVHSHHARTGSIKPARDIITDRIQKGVGFGNSTTAAGELAPMRKQLWEPDPLFSGNLHQPPSPPPTVIRQKVIPGAKNPFTNQRAPATVIPGKVIAHPPPPAVLAETQHAPYILQLKREFGDSFVKNWDRTNKPKELSTGRRIYHALDQALDSTHPAIAKINQRVSSLLSVEERAAAMARADTTGKKIFRGLAYPTIGLAVGGMGKYSGMDAPSSVAAGLLGIAVPAAITSPTARIALARGLYGAGKQLIKPNVQRVPAAIAQQAGLLGVRR